MRNIYIGLVVITILCAPCRAFTCSGSSIQCCVRTFQLSTTSTSCTFASNLGGSNHWIELWGVFGSFYQLPLTPTSSAGLTYRCFGDSGGLGIGAVGTVHQQHCLANVGSYTGAETVTFNTSGGSDFSYFVLIERANPSGTFEVNIPLTPTWTDQFASNQVTVTQGATSQFSSGTIYGTFMWAGTVPNPLTLSMSGSTVDFLDNAAITQGQFTCCATSAMSAIMGNASFSTGGGISISATQSGTSSANWAGELFNFHSSGALPVNAVGEKARRYVN